jgi:hypothetical protein
MLSRPVQGYLSTVNKSRLNQYKHVIFYWPIFFIKWKLVCENLLIRNLSSFTSNHEELYRWHWRYVPILWIKTINIPFLSHDVDFSLTPVVIFQCSISRDRVVFSVPNCINSFFLNALLDCGEGIYFFISYFFSFLMFFKFFYFIYQ